METFVARSVGAVVCTRSDEKTLVYRARIGDPSSTAHDSRSSAEKFLSTAS